MHDCCHGITAKHSHLQVIEDHRQADMAQYVCMYVARPTFD